jgi:hypothetical protein
MLKDITFKEKLNIFYLSRLRLSGMWCCIDQHVGTVVSTQHFVSIFRVDEDISNTFVCLVTTYKATRLHTSIEPLKQKSCLHDHLFNLVVPTCTVWLVILFREKGVVQRIKYRFSYFFLFVVLFTQFILDIK